jgi:hypothetical protein
VRGVLCVDLCARVRGHTQDYKSYLYIAGGSVRGVLCVDLGVCVRVHI